MCDRPGLAAAALSVFALTALPALNAYAAEDLADTIARTGELRIGTEGVYPPFTYHDKDGKLTGADVEFGRKLAEKLGVKPVFVVIPWEGVFPAFDSGRVDIILNQISVTPARLEKYDFSEPYGYVKGVLFVNKKNNELRKLSQLKGHTAAATPSSDWRVVAESYGAKVTPVPEFSHVIEQVATGRVEAGINSELAVRDLLKERPDTPIKVVDKTPEGLGVTVPVKKGSPKFIAAVNKAIEELRADGTLKAISLKFLGIDTSSK